MATWWKRMVTVVATLALTTQLGGSAAALTPSGGQHADQLAAAVAALADATQASSEATALASMAVTATPGATLVPASRTAAAVPTDVRDLAQSTKRPALPFGFSEPTAVLNSAAMEVPLGSKTFEVYDTITADLDDNGTPDIVSQLHVPLPVGNAQRFLVVQRGDGFGGMGAGKAYTIPDSSNSAYHHEGGVAATDVDGDGDLDLVVTTGRGLQLTTLLNAGDGTFPTQISTPVAMRLDRAVLATDLNGDGVPDLAAASHHGGGVQVLHGAGDGTFTPGDLLAHPSALNVSAITLGDDLVLVSSAASGAVKYWRSGAEGWEETTTGAPTAGGLGAYVGDFDGDGDDDLAVLRRAHDPTASELKVTIVVPMRNDDGTLVALPAVRATSSMVFPDLSFPRITGATADVDGDGRADLAVPGAYGDVAVLYGDVDAGFSSTSIHSAAPAYDTGTPEGWDTRDPDWPRSWGTVRETLAAALADVTGDGRADIVTVTDRTTPANAGSTHAVVSVVEGRGDRRFNAATLTEGSLWRWQASPWYDAAHLVDWDQDGRDDLVTIAPGDNLYRPHVVVAQGKVGGFGRPEVLPTMLSTSCSQGSAHRPTLIEDVDGDGHLDVVCADFTLGYLPGDGAGGLGPEVDLGNVSDNIYVDTSGLALGDLDGDGDQDLVYTTSKSGSDRVWVGWAERTATGFEAAELITSIGVEGATHRFLGRVAIADINGDDILDVVRIGEVNDGAARSVLFVLLGDGTGGFTQHTSPAPVGANAHVQTLDLDADNTLDLVAFSEYALGNYNQRASDVALLRGDGEGGFTTVQEFPKQNAGRGGFRVADLNGDDIPDLLATTIYRGVEVRAGAGDATFGHPVPFGVPDHGLDWVEALDYDDDGDLDIIGRGWNSMSSVGNHGARIGANLTLLENTGDTGGSGGAADLRASVTASPTALSGAEEVTLTLKTENGGQGTARDGWTDAVWLSTDDTWDVEDTLVATIPRTTLAAGDTATKELAVTLAPLHDGLHHLIVRADARGQVEESDEANNQSSTPLEWTLPTLEVGESLTVDADPAIVRIAPTTEALRLAAGDGAEDVAVRAGRVPTQAAAGQRLTGPGSLVLLPGQVRYVTVTGATTLSLAELPFGAGSVSPVVAAAGGQATFTVRGVGLDLADGFSLRSPDGTVVPAARLRHTAQGELVGTVDLTGAELGRWSVVVSDGSTTSELNAAVRVTDGSGTGIVRTGLFVPSRARADGTATAFITFANDGLTDAVLPIYRLRSAGASAPQGSDYELGDTTLFPDVGAGWMLPPGASGRLALKFHVDGDAPNGLRPETTWPQRGRSYLFELEEYGADSIEPYDASADYAEELEDLPPSGRQRVKEELARLLGTTGGSWVLAMHHLRDRAQGHPQLSQLRSKAWTTALRTGALTGHIRTPDGVGAGRLLVTLEDAAGAQARAVTNVDGDWVASGIGEPIALWVQGYGPGPVKRGDVSRVTLPDWATVHGVVRDAAGDPVVDALVMVASGEEAIQTETDDAGRYVMRDIAPGTHTLVVHHGESTQTREITVADERLAADVDLPEAVETAMLTGVVTSGGSPVVGAEVTAVGAPVVTTGADGTYRLDVPVGPALLVVTAAGFLDHTDELDIDGDTGHDVELQTSATLVLAVVDTDGVPVADQQVSIEQGGGTTHVSTDEAGQITRTVAAGEATVTMRTVSRTITLAAGETHTEQFVDRALVLTGRAPEPGAMVWVHRGDGTSEGIETDDAGAFSLVAEHGEELELRVVDPIAGVVRRSVTASAEATDLGLLQPAGVDLTIGLPWRSGPDDTSLVYLRPSDSPAERAMLVVPTTDRVIDAQTLVLADVPRGDYTVTVEADEGELVSHTEVTVDATDTAVVTLEPAPRPAGRAARGAAARTPSGVVDRAQALQRATEVAAPRPLSPTELKDAILDAFLLDDPEVPGDLGSIAEAELPEQPEDGCSVIDTSGLIAAKRAAREALALYADVVELSSEIRWQTGIYAAEAAFRAGTVVNEVINAFVAVGKIIKISTEALTTIARGQKAIHDANVAAAFVKSTDSYSAMVAKLGDIEQRVEQVKLIPELIGKAVAKFVESSYAMLPGDAVGAMTELVKEIGPILLTLADGISELVTDKALPLSAPVQVLKELLGPISAVFAVMDQIKANADSYAAAMRLIDNLSKAREQALWGAEAKAELARDLFGQWMGGDNSPIPLTGSHAPEACDPPKDPPPPNTGPRGPFGPAGGTTWGSNDPNQITGPAGVGAARWLHPGSTMSYEIAFENLGPGSNEIPDGQELATAPAARVAVTLPLGEWVDLDRVSLGEFGFGAGEVIFEPPTGARSFTAERPFSVRVDDLYTGEPTELDLLLRAAALVDRRSRAVVWNIELVDPDTGLPHPDPAAGFLPPEPVETPGAGQGYAIVELGADAHTGDKGLAQASIVFDSNAAIETNVWSNSFDSTAPGVVDFAVQSGEPNGSGGVPSGTTVKMSATDPHSGVGTFDVWRSLDGGPLTLWRHATKNPTLTVTGPVGQRVAFAARATDLVGNAGPPPEHASFTTTIAAPEVRISSFKVVRKPRVKKRGVIRIRIATSTGQAVKGKLTLTMKKKVVKGKRAVKKRVRVTVRDGRQRIRLPRLSRGTWRVRAQFKSSLGSAAGGPWKLKVRR